MPEISVQYNLLSEIQGISQASAKQMDELIALVTLYCQSRVCNSTQVLRDIKDWIAVGYDFSIQPYLDRLHGLLTDEQRNLPLIRQFRNNDKKSRIEALELS